MEFSIRWREGYCSTRRIILGGGNLKIERTSCCARTTTRTIPLSELSLHPAVIVRRRFLELFCGLFFLGLTGLMLKIGVNYCFEQKFVGVWFMGGLALSIGICTVLCWGIYWCQRGHFQALIYRTTIPVMLIPCRQVSPDDLLRLARVLPRTAADTDGTTISPQEILTKLNFTRPADQWLIDVGMETLPCQSCGKIIDGEYLVRFVAAADSLSPGKRLCPGCARRKGMMYALLNVVTGIWSVPGWLMIPAAVNVNVKGGVKCRVDGTPEATEKSWGIFRTLQTGMAFLLLIPAVILAGIILWLVARAIF